ncbi:unnamed protein product [Paramecium pentaurelia]|uniref:RING-type domain-containing protein n=1 Tax=Paramecium pentaurelia TaxID=43138 RepID=A0A8S1TB06_9CILI|nr:unnamed protein product [Paramecium pentaurelia]
MMNISKCSYCQKVPDDILMLTCNHDLCLDCAAKSFSIQQAKKNKKFFVCDICQLKTELDSNSVYELEKIHLAQTLQDRSNRKPVLVQKTNISSEKQVKSKSQTRQDNKENQKEKTIKFAIQNPEAKSSFHLSQRQMSKHQSENSFIQHSREQCFDHPEEDVSYFCFDCNSRCICPECIIHGIHKNHEVKTIKKSYPLIRKQLENQIEQNEQQINQIENQRQDLEKKQVQQTAIQEHMRLQIAQEFQVLHQLLNNKQNELLDKVCNLPSIIDSQENYINRLNDIQIKLQNLNDKIYQIIEQKSEIELLNYYGYLQNQTTPQIPPSPNIKVIQLSNLIFSQINDAKKMISGMDVDYNQ